MTAEFDRVGCPVIPVEREKLGRVGTVRALWRSLKEIDPAIVQPFAFAWYFAIPAARLARVPRIVVAERTIPPWKTWWHLLSDRLLLSFVDSAIVNSQKVLEAMVKLNKMASARCHVVYNGLDLLSFDELALKYAAGLPETREGDPVICAVANTIDDKRLDILVKAFSQVVLEAPSAKLWIVGDGNRRQDLERLVLSLDLGDRVSFWGTRSDVPAILSRVTIGINSSRVEGLCNAIIEYMAARLPVIATRVGGNPELVIHLETGLLVPPENPDELADGILYLIRNPAVARRFGQAGRRSVERNFTIDRMVGAIESIYDNLVA